MPRRYLVQFDPGTGRTVTWFKTAAELLAPNGDEPLLIWMLRECEERNLYFYIESLTERTEDEG